LMKSESVAYLVRNYLRTNNPELNPVPVTLLVAQTPKTSIFNLEALGADAAYTQAYLQATMDEYVNLKKKMLDEASSATALAMQAELAKMSEELDRSKQALLDYQASNNVVLLEPNGGNAAADHLATLNQELEKDKSDLHQLETLTLDEALERQLGIFAQPKTPTNTTVPGAQGQTNIAPVNGVAVISSAGTNLPKNDLAQNTTPAQLGAFEADYLDAKRQIVRLKFERKDLIENHELLTTSDRVVQKDKEIAQMEEQLAIDERESEQQLINQQHILKLQIKGLEDQISNYRANVLDVNKKLEAYRILKENTKRLQSIYDDRQAALKNLEMNKGIGQESVSTYGSVSHPVPLPAEKKKHMTMAGLIGLVLGIGIMVLIDRLDDRPTSLTELEKLFDLPVLGQFPLVKAKKRKEGVLILQPDDDRHALVEAYRTLRSALLFRDSPKQHPKTIVITSASPNDGKSMTSANFAITLAQAGARVLLVDADLRRGVMHKNFFVSSSPGLAEALTGKRDWSKSVITTAIPNLYLLPCGTPPERHGNMFANSGKFLEDIAGKYDYVVFDTAPVLVADDVLSLAPHVDGLIMVIRAGFTSGHIAHAALNLLHLRRVNVMGLVFNAVHPKASDYYYDRFKEYYENPRAGA